MRITEVDKPTMAERAVLARKIALAISSGMLTAFALTATFASAAIPDSTPEPDSISYETPSENDANTSETEDLRGDVMMPSSSDSLSQRQEEVSWPPWETSSPIAEPAEEDVADIPSINIEAPDVSVEAEEPVSSASEPVEEEPVSTVCHFDNIQHRLGVDRAHDNGMMNEWQPGYYCVHNVDSDGVKILSLSVGDLVEVDGHEASVSEIITTREDEDYVPIREYIGLDKIALQTCLDDYGNNRVVCCNVIGEELLFDKWVSKRGNECDMDAYTMKDPVYAELADEGDWLEFERNAINDYAYRLNYGDLRYSPNRYDKMNEYSNRVRIYRERKARYDVELANYENSH